MTIETKFEIGDTLFLLQNNSIINGVVIGFVSRSGRYARDDFYNVGTFYALQCNGFDLQDKPERILFKTKQELLDSL